MSVCLSIWQINVSGVLHSKQTGQRGMHALPPPKKEPVGRGADSDTSIIGCQAVPMIAPVRPSSTVCECGEIGCGSFGSCKFPSASGVIALLVAFSGTRGTLGRTGVGTRGTGLLPFGLS